MITMKNVIREGHPTLYKVAKEVRLPLSSQDKKLLKDLLQYVINSQDDEIAEKYELRPAVGIAAPQVNQSKRMFAVHVRDFDGTLYSYALVNPVLKAKSTDIIYVPGGEGCLSVDRETEGLTPRYGSVVFEALNYDIEKDELVPVELKLHGYVGIVFQHEFDHINGIMYVSKLFPQLPNAKPAFEFVTSEDDEDDTI
ncbi:MAG TPA: peptide deformylase [Acholeplasmataceae bacterium]|jgi:peptide deformylase|nr:peptide deformylase [Acholeplasmataceae bacterium]HRX45140.1 peptide deformylase [Acholeplasmataceae bacterium]